MFSEPLPTLAVGRWFPPPPSASPTMRRFAVADFSFYFLKKIKRKIVGTHLLLYRASSIYL
jgi:hypothetical protein